MWSDMDREPEPEPEPRRVEPCEECTTSVSCEDAGRCLFGYFEDGGTL